MAHLGQRSCCFVFGTYGVEQRFLGKGRRFFLHRAGICWSLQRDPKKILFTPRKTNMSPENQWLEDVFPIEIDAFYGTC